MFSSTILIPGARKTIVLLHEQHAGRRCRPDAGSARQLRRPNTHYAAFAWSNTWTSSDRWEDTLFSVRARIISSSPLLSVKALSLPCSVVFDADGDTEADTPEKQTRKRRQHERENITPMKLMGITDPIPFPENVQSDMTGSIELARSSMNDPASSHQRMG
jgi:hypothetical protein